MKFVDRSHVTSSHQRFFKFKNLKSWQENIHVGMENDSSAGFVLLCGWNNEDVRWGFFSIQIHWEVMSNLSFLGSSRNSNLFITSEWIWIWKKPTVHLPYFIHRVRQNCQTNHLHFQMNVFFSVFSNFWIWKTVDVMKSHDFCQRLVSWKISKENVWAKFYIPTGCGRYINKDC